MKVQDLMTTEVHACRANESLNRAARIMWEYDCGCVPIVDSDSNVVGMLTDRDICMAAYLQGKRLTEIPVTTAMSREVFSCTPNDGLRVAEEIMQNMQVRRLPVLDEEGKLEGLISLNDLARRAEEEKEKPAKTKELEYEEVARTLASVCHAHGRPSPVPA